MAQNTTVIAERRFFRQESAPQQAPDGATWVTESDGAGNDTASRYTYDAETGVWELNSAVGPSEPNAGTNVPGATWRDTSAGTAKQYDGSTFTSLSPSNTQGIIPKAAQTVNDEAIDPWDGTLSYGDDYDTQVSVGEPGNEIVSYTLRTGNIYEGDNDTDIVGEISWFVGDTKIGSVDPGKLSSGMILADNIQVNGYDASIHIDVENTDNAQSYTYQLRLDYEYSGKHRHTIS